jgi:hypothetical protein
VTATEWVTPVYARHLPDRIRSPRRAAARPVGLIWADTALTAALADIDGVIAVFGDDANTPS